MLEPDELVHKRVGLLGGTFDPVHIGHLQLADIAAQQLKLDKVLFIPAAVPPHKPDQKVASYRHRVRMIELALMVKTGMEVSTIEHTLPTPSYTIDTLRVLERTGKPKDYFYITGLDAFLEIDTWKSYTKLLEGVNFIVIARSGYNHTILDRFLHQLGYVKDKKGWMKPLTKKRFFFLEKEIADISSSRIRDLIKNDEYIGTYLPPLVVRYIQENRLYRS